MERTLGTLENCWNHSAEVWIDTNRKHDCANTRLLFANKKSQLLTSGEQRDRNKRKTNSSGLCWREIYTFYNCSLRVISRLHIVVSFTKVCNHCRRRRRWLIHAIALHQQIFVNAFAANTRTSGKYGKFIYFDISNTDADWYTFQVEEKFPLWGRPRNLEI